MAHDFWNEGLVFDGRSSGGLDPRGMLMRESACAAVDHPVLSLVVPEFCNPRFQQGGGVVLEMHPTGCIHSSGHRSPNHATQKQFLMLKMQSPARFSQSF